LGRHDWPAEGFFGWKEEGLAWLLVVEALVLLLLQRWR
jgi:uncharacterized membrane protein